MPLSINECIEFAIEQEIKAADLYEKYAKIVKDRGAQKMLEEMAAMERGHEKKLRNFKENSKEILAKFGEIPDMHISDYIIEKNLSAEIDVQDVYVFAMKAEEMAYQLYTRIANLESSSGRMVLFLNLAEEEKKHKFDLEQEYEREMMQEG